VKRALVDLHWRADTRPLRATIESVLAQEPAAAAKLADSWLTLAFCERDLAAAEQALQALSGNNFGQNVITLTRNFGYGLLARLRGDTAAAQLAFTAARTEQEEVVRAQPDFAPALCVLGMIDAALGRKEEALRAGGRAVELLPASKDLVVGVQMTEFFAITAAWAGENDLAIEQLEATVAVPGRLSYGHLKLHPLWDPLRRDPRFEKIVARLAPQ
jgi:tetratricopeptide (TPR) repeat protein